MNLKKLTVAFLLLAFIAVLFAFFQREKISAYVYPVSRTAEKKVLDKNYSEKCLSLSSENKPAWECYEIPIDSEDGSSVSIVHTSGERHKTLSFKNEKQHYFRFTPSRKGEWCYFIDNDLESEADCLDINEPAPKYAKGFVAAKGTKWVRTNDGQAFLPQYVMYEKSDIDEGLETFIGGHGFTGFHITHLRNFLKNPEFFEAVILKTYRSGGTTHFWLWGDRSRRLTPDTFGVDVKVLYNAIAARLYPLPGWTLGYGFDLHEWVKKDEISEMRKLFESKSSYRHLIGARGYKNKYKEISKNLDYASWEWHRPKIGDYIDHLREANTRPAFSEDRFRIRPSKKHAYKDYTFEMTRKGLWHSLFSGGVANIWGYKGKSNRFSAPYPNKDQFKIYKNFVDRYYSNQTKVIRPLINGAVCLDMMGDLETIACLLEGFNRTDLEGERSFDYNITAFNLKKSFAPVQIDLKEGSIIFPEKSDWVVLMRKK